MHEIRPDQLAPGSACAIVLRGSATAPQYLLASDHGGLGAAHWRRRRSSLAETVRLPEHLLSICIGGHGTGRLVVDGIETETDHRRHAAFFLPAGSSVRWTLEAPVEMEHLHLYIAPSLLRAVPPTALHDRWIDGYAELLAADHAAGAPSDFLEATAPLLLRHLERLAEAAAPAGDHGVSALRPFILRRVLLHLEDHLAEPVRLPALAALAGLSVDHFVRAFRKATGATPHRHLLERRLDRAAQLLRETTAPVAEIAHACGFAACAHFSAAFHRQFGLTPSAWRRRA